MRCTGVILAGGAATRYGGSPKGLELVGGKRIIDRVAAALSASSDELLLIANAPEASEWLPGVRVHRDLLPGQGSLGGLLTAIVCAASPILVVAWDMPFVPAELLHDLRELGETRVDALYDAVLPEGQTAKLEPLCGWYAPSCEPVIRSRIVRGDLRVSALAEELHVRVLPRARMQRYGATENLFMNVNCAEDRALAERYARSVQRDS